MTDRSIDLFVEGLGRMKADGTSVFNPYADNGEARARLKDYLQAMTFRAPATLCVGEAPGRRGCAQSGVPFTSLRVMLKRPFGLFDGFHIERALAETEGTAPMVWDVFQQLEFCLPLWNAHPFNPIDPSTRKNRRPSDPELNEGRDVLDEFRKLFPSIQSVVAVGGSAARLLGRIGCAHHHVPHPSHGNKVRFRSGPIDLLDRGAIR
ncbi:MAG: hypothetical protein IPL77_00915 [Flavobacteriales bacterium]|nr:hypothetical protein [Flavobacteriales bacterium]MBK9073528.1 hypothetical protein [Flavobacteriales bacterium]MBK9539212.1 hypothetical protein [Flavobacteriales bacterium]